MNLRLAELQDVTEVLELVHRVVPVMRAAGNLQWDSEYPNRAVFESDISKKQLWLAEIDRVIAGIAAITLDQEPEYAHVGWDISERAIVIHRLAVDPAFQGKGIALALMQRAEALAIESGIFVLRVDTNSQNQATQRLFPKLGYTLDGEISLYFRPGLRFLCYQKSRGFFSFHFEGLTAPKLQPKVHSRWTRIARTCNRCKQPCTMEW